MDLFDLCCRITELGAVSGSEYICYNEFHEIIKDYFDEIIETPTNSVIGVKRCGKKDAKKLMLDAHIDEIGFVVTEICDNGFLKVAPIGGIDTRVLSASEVYIYGKQKLTGVFTSKPPHLQAADEAKKKLELSALAIDTGLSKDKLSELVSIGTVVGFKNKTIRLNGDIITGKSMDNRICICAALRTLELLDVEKMEHDIYCLFSVREETGYVGSMTGGYQIDPDIAIVLDVGNSCMPNGPREKENIVLENGPIISFSATTDRKISKKLIELALKNKIPYQPVGEPNRTGSNAHAVQVIRNGVPTCLISIPLRYMHTNAEVVSLLDVENCAVLLSKFCEDIK